MLGRTVLGYDLPTLHLSSHAQALGLLCARLAAVSEFRKYSVGIDRASFVLAEAQCCSILQSVGFAVTPGIPVFIVDTSGQTVGGSGIGQDGQATNGDNGQDSTLISMQMCTCSAGVTNATYSGPAKIRLRGGNNSGLLP